MISTRRADKFRTSQTGAIVTLLAAIIGCSTQHATRADAPGTQPSGRVSGNVIDASDADHYKPTAGVRYDAPAPSPDNALPHYPDEMLSRRLEPIEIKIRLIVDEHGAVTEIRPLGSRQDDAPFVAAVQSAVTHWQFTPLVQIVDGPGDTLIATGGSSVQYAGAAKALAFHQDYAFVFEQTDGKPAVRATNNNAASGL
ncbi:MAG: hypothetical protein ABJB01_06085 [Rudaea sp.]